MKKLISFTLLLLITLTIFASCTKSSGFDVNLSYDIDTLDPQIASNKDAFTLLDLLYEPLYRFDKDKNIVPAAAKNCIIENDNTRFTFILREDCFYSDGTKVTAHDFYNGIIFSLLNSESSSVYNLFPILNADKFRAGKANANDLGIVVLSDFTLQITLKESIPNFLEYVCMPSYFPRNENLVKKTNGKYGKEAGTTIGNGPMKMKNSWSWDLRKSITLNKNPYYNGNASTFNEITFKLNSDKTSLFSVSNNENLFASLSLFEEKQANKKNIKLSTIDNVTYGILFNTNNDKLKSKDTRQALFAIILDALKNSDLSFLENTINLDLYDNFLATANLNIRVKSLNLLIEKNNLKDIANDIVIDLNHSFNQFFNFEEVEKNELIRKVKNNDFDIAIFPLLKENPNILSLYSTLALDYNIDKNGILSLLEQESDSTNEKARQIENYLITNFIFLPIYYSHSTYAYRATFDSFVLTNYGVILSSINE